MTECCGESYGFIEIDLSGDPLNYQYGLVGTYIFQQNDLVTGRNYWLHENGKYGIWYTEHNINAWMVGTVGNLGTNTGGLGTVSQKYQS